MFEKEISKFRELFRIGISSLKEAARIYVAALDHDIAAREIFQAANPEVPLSAWASLEKIGRGQMHEKLFLMCGRIQASLRSLPLSEQTEAIEKGIPVLLHDGSSMLMKPEAMTQSQQTQVFSNGTVRTIDAQRAWMESQRNYRGAHPQPQAEDPPRAQRGLVRLPQPAPDALRQSSVSLPEPQPRVGKQADGRIELEMARPTPGRPRASWSWPSRWSPRRSWRRPPADATPASTTRPPRGSTSASRSSRGNPVSYRVLKHHPGDSKCQTIDDAVTIPAEYMLHIYRQDRPGLQDEDGEIMTFTRLGGFLKSYRKVKPKAA